MLFGAWAKRGARHQGAFALAWVCAAVIPGHRCRRHWYTINHQPKLLPYRPFGGDKVPERFQAKWNHLATRKTRPHKRLNRFQAKWNQLATRKTRPHKRLNRFQATWNHLAARKTRPRRGLNLDTALADGAGLIGKSRSRREGSPAPCELNRPGFAGGCFA